MRVIAFVLLAAIAELTGVVGAAHGGSRRYDGPMGKSDRAFMFGALGLGLGCGIDVGTWVDVLLAAVNVLLVLTVVNRMRNGIAEVERT